MDLLLAIQKRGEPRQVRLDPAAHRSLSETFEALSKAFLNRDTEVSDYAPGFRPEDDGLQVLDFELPESLWRCRATTPNDLRPLDQRPRRPARSTVGRGIRRP
jgi:hypothetical protein